MKNTASQITRNDSQTTAREVTNDEGCIDNKDLPHFLSALTDSQKADIAFQLLRSLTQSTLTNIQDKLRLLLYSDLITKLPVELSLKIMANLDHSSLLNSQLVNKYWKSLANDMKLWKALYKRQGWTYNSSLIKYYKANHLNIPSQLGLVNTDARLGRVSSSGMTKTCSDNPISTHGLRKQLYKQIHHNHLHSLPSSPRMQTSFREPRSSGAADVPMSPSSSRMARSHNTSNQLAEELMRLNLGTDTQLLSSTPIHDTRPNQRPISIDGVLGGERHRPIPLDLTMSIGDGESPLNTGFMSNISIEEMFTPILESPINEQEQQQQSGDEMESVMMPRRILNHEYQAAYDGEGKMGKCMESNRLEIQTHHSRLVNWKRLYQMKHMLQCNWNDHRFTSHTLQGHTEGIYCLQLDENSLFSGSRDNTVKQWDMQTGLCVKTFTGHQASVLCLQYDHAVLITGSSDATVIVWSRSTGEILHCLEQHMDSVLNLSFDRQYLITCSKDRTIKVFDRLDRYKLLRTLQGHRVAVNAVQFSGDRIVSASGDRTIKIWSLETGKLTNTLEGHSRGIASLCLAGDIIVSGSSDRTIKLWSLETGEYIRTLEGHEDLVRTLAVREGVVVSGSYDRSVRFWDLATGVCLKVLRLHRHRIFKLGLAKTKLVSCSQHPGLVVWDFASDLNTLFIV